MGESNEHKVIQPIWLKVTTPLNDMTIPAFPEEFVWQFIDKVVLKLDCFYGHRVTPSGSRFELTDKVRRVAIPTKCRFWECNLKNNDEVVLHWMGEDSAG